MRPESKPLIFYTPIPQNGQTHSNNSLVIWRQIDYFGHFVILALKGLSKSTFWHKAMVFAHKRYQRRKIIVTSLQNSDLFNILFKKIAVYQTGGMLNYIEYFSSFRHIIRIFYSSPVREKCPYSELFWFTFSRIRTE